MQFQQFQFNGMPIDSNMLNQRMNQAYELCKSHINCDGCPLIKYQPLQFQDGAVYCENGRDKTNGET